MAAKRWPELHDHIVTPLDRHSYCVRIKDFALDEKPLCLALCQHGNLLLFGFYGRIGQRNRLVGYLLLYAGAPLVHQYTKYVSISYSEPTDIRSRDVQVIFNDANIRLLRFGVGVFDYLWVCRKSSEFQYCSGHADDTAHLKFSGTWKDGI